uniref:Uncharacterized protein n=1 Tax=Arundo donax TaxID=35708 RepID=A0A0A8Y014_ARUDO
MGQARSKSPPASVTYGGLLVATAGSTELTHRLGTTATSPPVGRGGRKHPGDEQCRGGESAGARYRAAAQRHEEAAGQTVLIHALLHQPGPCRAALLRLLETLGGPAASTDVVHVVVPVPRAAAASLRHEPPPSTEGPPPRPRATSPHHAGCEPRHP